MIPDRPTTVTCKPLDQPAAPQGWCLIRTQALTPCAAGHPDPQWGEDRYALGQLDHGAWCADCAADRAPAYLLELVGLANAAARVLDAAPVGWQADTAEKAITVLRSVLVDFELT